MQTNKSKLLGKLQMRTPDPQVAQRVGESRLLGMQQQIAKAPTPGRGQPTPGIREAQQLGAQQAAEQGQATLEAAARRRQTAATEAKQALNQDQLQHQQEMAKRRANLAKVQRENERRLNQLGEGAKDRLLDKRIEFQKDEAGRNLLNDYQWQDLAVLQAESQEDLKDLQQKMSQARKNKLLLLEKQHQLMTNALKSDFRWKGQKLDQRTRKQIKQRQQQVEQWIQAERARAANQAAQNQAIGTAAGVGVGIGAVALGGPAAAAAAPAIISGSAAAGGGLSSLLGG